MTGRLSILHHPTHPSSQLRNGRREQQRSGRSGRHLGTGVRGFPLGTLEGSGTLGSKPASYFVTTGCGHSSSFRGLRLMLRARVHAKKRCPGSHLEEGRRATQIFEAMGHQCEYHLQKSEPRARAWWARDKRSGDGGWVAGIQLERSVKARPCRSCSRF